MELNIQERFALLGLLPQQGDFHTIRIVRELRETLSFTEEEHAALQFKDMGEGRVTWDADADQPREFVFGARSMKIIQDALEKADRDKKLTLEHVALYEKAFPDEPEIRLLEAEA